MKTKNQKLQIAQDQRDAVIEKRGSEALKQAFKEGKMKKWTATVICRDKFPKDLQDFICYRLFEYKPGDTVRVFSPEVTASKEVAAASVKKASKAKKNEVVQAAQIDIKQAKQDIEKKIEAAKVESTPNDDLAAAIARTPVEQNAQLANAILSADAIRRDETGKVDMNIKPSKKAVKPPGAKAIVIALHTDSPAPSKKGGIPLDAPFKSVTEQGFKLVKSPNSIA